MTRRRAAVLFAVLAVVVLLVLLIPPFARFASPSGCISLFGVRGCF
jgi:hypothetical protein